MQIPTNLDHIVVATPHLDRTVTSFETATGVRAKPGGIHPRFGTRNFLVALGSSAYLQIVGVDVDLVEPEADISFWGLDTIYAPTVRTFAVHSVDPEGALLRAVAAGIDLGPLELGARRSPKGDLLTWRLTRPLTADPTGVLPFLMDWGNSVSPAESTAAHVDLVDFRLTHPNPVELRRLLEVLETDPRVVEGNFASLALTVAGPAGQWSLG